MTRAHAANTTTVSGPNGRSEPVRFQEIELNAAPDAILAQLINASVAAGASDLFIASNEDDVDVTIRTLGIVKPLASLSRETGLRCIVCLRNLAGMKLDEHRRPMDGRGRFHLQDGKWVDLRVSS